jgi:hypothetical protein
MFTYNQRDLCYGEYHGILSLFSISNYEHVITSGNTDLSDNSIIPHCYFESEFLVSRTYITSAVPAQ